MKHCRWKSKRYGEAYRGTLQRTALSLDRILTVNGRVSSAVSVRFCMRLFTYRRAYIWMFSKYTYKHRLTLTHNAIELCVVGRCQKAQYIGHPSIHFYSTIIIIIIIILFHHNNILPAINLYICLFAFICPTSSTLSIVFP